MHTLNEPISVGPPAFAMRTLSSSSGVINVVPAMRSRSAGLTVGLSPDIGVGICSCASAAASGVPSSVIEQTGIGWPLGANGLNFQSLIASTNAWSARVELAWRTCAPVTLPSASMQSLAQA